MSERNDLLVTIAETIKTYRSGEIETIITAEHVDRWVSQFTPCHQLAFLKEFAHVIDQTFITEENIKQFLLGLLKNKSLVGENNSFSSYWRCSNFLNIQKHGQSQRQMLQLFEAVLYTNLGVRIETKEHEGGDYIYLDDILFTGNRIYRDLHDWILNKAPQKAKVHVIIIVYHTSGLYYLKQKLSDTVKEANKEIEIDFLYLGSIENRRYYKNSSEILWPTQIPNFPLMQDYLLSNSLEIELRQNLNKKYFPFSSEIGRQLLEEEFLISGIKILSQFTNPNPIWKPLGFGPFGLGFGSMIVTYRNCPNNCPLALWWGDPDAEEGSLHWYPLLRRKTYTDKEYLINAFNDVS